MEQPSSDEDLRIGSLLSSDDEQSVTLFQDKEVAKLENNKRKRKQNPNGKETKSSESSEDEEAKKLLSSETSLKLQTDEEAKKLLSSETSLKLQTDEEAKKLLSSETSPNLQTDNEEAKKLLSSESSPNLQTDDEEVKKLLGSKTSPNLHINDEEAKKLLGSETSLKLQMDEEAKKLLGSETSLKLQMDEEAKKLLGSGTSLKLQKRQLTEEELKIIKDCVSIPGISEMPVDVAVNYEDDYQKDSESIDHEGIDDRSRIRGNDQPTSNTDGDFPQASVEEQTETNDDAEVDSAQIDSSEEQRGLKDDSEVNIKKAFEMCETMKEVEEYMSNLGFECETVEIHARVHRDPNESEMHPVVKYETVEPMGTTGEAHRDHCGSEGDFSNERKAVETDGEIEEVVTVPLGCASETEADKTPASEVDFSKEHSSVEPEGEIEEDVTVPLGCAIKIEADKNPASEEPEGETEKDVTVPLISTNVREAVERMLSKVANHCDTKTKGTNQSVTREPVGEFGKDLSLQGLKSETVEVKEETRVVHCPSEKTLRNEQKVAEFKTIMKDISLLMETEAVKTLTSEVDFSKEHASVEPEGEMEEDVTVPLGCAMETEAVERMLIKVANHCDTKIKGTNESVTREPIGEFGKDLSLQGLKSETVEVHEETRVVHCPSKKTLTNEQEVAELETVMKDILLLIEDANILREIILDIKDEIRRKKHEDLCNSRIDSSKQIELVGPMGEIGQDVAVSLGTRNESEELKSPKQAHDDDCYSEERSMEEELKKTVEEIGERVSQLKKEENTDAIKKTREVILYCDSKGDSEKEHKLTETMGEIGNDAAIPLGVSDETLEETGKNINTEPVILCEKCSASVINLIDAPVSVGNTQQVNEESNTHQDKSSKEKLISPSFQEVVDSFTSQNTSFLRSIPVTYDPYEGLLRDYESPPSELTDETAESPHEGGKKIATPHALVEGVKLRITGVESDMHIDWSFWAHVKKNKYLGSNIRDHSLQPDEDLRKLYQKSNADKIRESTDEKEFKKTTADEFIHTSDSETSDKIDSDESLSAYIKSCKTEGDLKKPIAVFSLKPDDPQQSASFPFPEIKDSPNSSKKSDADEIPKCSSDPEMSYKESYQSLIDYMVSLKAWGDIKLPIVEFPPSESEDSRSRLTSEINAPGKNKSDATRESTDKALFEQCTADDPQALEHRYSRRYVQRSVADLRRLRENTLALLTSSRDSVSQFSSSMMGSDSFFVGRCVRTLASSALRTLAKFTEEMMEKVKNDIKFYEDI